MRSSASRSWVRFSVTTYAFLLMATLSIAAEPAPHADEAGVRQRIRELRAGLRDVPLPWIIEEWSGHHVRRWNGERRAELAAVAAEVVASINRNTVVAARANEAGNAVENVVIGALTAHGFQAARPAGPSGREHAAGYPDVEAIAADTDDAYYVEVKTFNPGTRDSPQRTFYLSPSTDFKVTRDAFHLLVAVELTHDTSGHFRALSARWLDLSRLRCDLKPEFNASNRDLYRDTARLTVIEVAAEIERPAAGAEGSGSASSTTETANP